MHFLLWIKDAPIYGSSKNNKIENFVDKYISCDSSFLDQTLSKIQTHHHTRTCKKHKNSTCYFGFPLPPMKRTTILERLPNIDKTMKDKAKAFFAELQNQHYTAKTTFHNFLNKFKM